MVRPKHTDFLQSFKFALIEIPGDPNEQTAFFDREGLIAGRPGMIGCKSISIPEITSEPFSFREGTEMFEHHINAGHATTGTCVITLAVIPFGGVGLYSWMHRAIYGKGSPRKNFVVVHLSNPASDFTAGLGARKYALDGCIPTSYKLASDFDGSSDEISLEEITLAVHRVKLEIPRDKRAEEEVALNRAEDEGFLAF